MMYKSQVGQDKWVIEMLNNKQNGYFIDIGAYDGINISNTYTLEKEFNWDGLCIEADKNNYDELIKHRNVKSIHCAVSDKNGYVNFTGDGSGGHISENGTTVLAKTIKTILIENSCPKIIDYISLDIEGAELLVLETFPFDEYKIKLLTIEHNLYLGDNTNKEKIKSIMLRNGYTLFRENVINVGNDPFEDWYINQTIINDNK